MFRNKAILSLARLSPVCFMCERQNDGTVVAAHSNQLRDGKGKGIKAHDYRVAYLCQSCHTEIDQGNHYSKAEKFALWDEAHRKTIGWLFENSYLAVSAKPAAQTAGKTKAGINGARTPTPAYCTPERK